MRTRLQTARTRRRSHGDRGATMVEFGLVAVLLFALILFIVEGAFGVRARNTVNNATDDAARRGAIAAASPSADYQILRQLRGRGLGVNSSGTIEQVVVYRAATANAPVDPACLSSSQTGMCNRYVAADLLRPEGDFGCLGGGLDDNWCPDQRVSATGITFLGVYVEVKYEPLTSALGGDLFKVDLVADSQQAIETSGED